LARTCVVEEDHVLWYDSDCSAERPKLHLPYVAPVDADRAGLGVEEAEEQPEDGRLARSRRADHRARLPRLDAEGDVPQDHAVWAVAEADAVKLDEPAGG
jgi:hypothetical protein